MELVFLGIALLFVPNSVILLKESSVNVYLLPLKTPFASAPCHYAAILVNFLGLALSLTTIFLYKRRTLQMKLCYVSLILWCLLISLMAFCPFVTMGNGIVEVQTNYSGVIIGLFAVVAALLAARFINKDRELLKSADRIR